MTTASNNDNYFVRLSTINVGDYIEKKGQFSYLSWPILAPTSFDINTSIQRCLVKAIALHGLGLSIYAGEDLPIADGSDEAVPLARAHRRRRRGWRMERS